MSKTAVRDAVHAAYDEDGVPEQEQSMGDYIRVRESIKNLAHPGGKRHRDGSNGCMYGNWQLNKAKAGKCDWWDPHEATHMAVRYMRNRSYGKFGRGIVGAYRHKKAHGTY
jgi:hypothetical protein